MKGAFIIFCFSVLALFAYVKSAPFEKSEREKTIEYLIRNSFSDPVNLGNFTVGPGNGVLRVNQIVNNMICTGLSTARRDATADLAAGTIFLAYDVDQLTAEVDYELDGYCLLMPIWGKGKGVVVMNDVRVTAKATVEETVDNKIKIVDMKITYDVTGGSFDLDSLFNEPQPKLLTRMLVKTLNANAEYVFNEILDAYIPQSEVVLTKAWGMILANV